MTLDTERVDAFDRIRGQLEGLPGVTSTRPSTQVESLPLVGDVTTYVLETMRLDDGRLLTFLQIVDAEGRARIILPDKVVRAIVRQRDRLFDRSTPASRTRKARSRERARKREMRRQRRERDHRDGKHDPEVRKARGWPPRMKGCPLCEEDA